MSQSRITATIGSQLYKIDIHTATNEIVSDEPKALGGQDSGFSPSELLAASLGACTCATLRMYADRKGWALLDIKADVTFERDKANNRSIFTRTIELIGDLDAEQRARLLDIANKCPIHQALTNPIEVNTQLL
ncbi:MAG: OsmC family protein [Chitinophagaceae bacterium]